LPHVPGIDCAGTVAESSSDQFKVGDAVLATGYSMGETRWGGWSAYVRLPAEYVVPLPSGLTLRESMIYGTAGFTAAQCLKAILDRGIDPSRGPAVVTGSTGGVGSIAVGLLAKAGFEVVAVSGKPEAEEMLNQLGASRVIGREEVVDTSDKPLLKAQWSAAVDTVGGKTLETLLRSTMHRGVVAACGLVGGVNVPMTVYPFILRGVSLIGIDSAQCPMDSRLELWQHLATDWKLSQLDSLAQGVPLAEVTEQVQLILAGKMKGRMLVEVAAA
jgi:putative YhdH/YhfP family quinone oxidoreductase